VRKILVAGGSLLAMVMLVACQQSGSPTAPVSAERGASIEAVSGSKQSKSNICHVDDDGLFHVVNVADPAVAAHVEHGDHLVTAEVCGDDIDNNCDRQVDEGCAAVTCPCEDLKPIADLGLRGGDLCSESDYVLSFGSAGPFSRSGFATSSVENGNTSCLWQFGTLELARADFTAAEAEACHDAIRDHAGSLGVNCL
jgi:hypothetical protein